VTWPDVRLTRRRALQLLGAAAAAGLLPPLALRRAAASSAVLPPYGFLTTDELAILEAATAVILPTDDRPGAREIGVVDYIQSLLSFLPGSDANCDRHVGAADLIAVHATVAGRPLTCATGGDVDGDGVADTADVRAAEAAIFRARPMFAAGPYSGRNPQAHFPIGRTPCQACHGARAGGTGGGGGTGPEKVLLYPPAAFRQFYPMNRLQRLSWQLRLLGKDAAPPQVAANPLLDELQEMNLRARYREGLAQLEAIAQQRHQQPFIRLTASQQATVLDRVNPRFLDLLRRHVIQGTLCVPEYGGNRDRLGWQLVGFDGDSQPLGYEIYDESAPGFYRERPDKPNRGPNPDEDCAGFSADMQRFLELISGSAGGGRFESEPYCFEVDDEPA
jgi:hypothetical protein